MAQQTIDLRVNPSDETIRLGPLAVRFLLTGDNSTSSVAAFELVVPGAQRLAAPAHSHDHYEETIYGIDGVLTWTVDGKQIDVGPGQALCIPRGAIHRFDNNGAQEVKALCVITPAALDPQYFRECAEVSTRRPVVRRTEQSWRRSCAATASLRLRLTCSTQTTAHPEVEMDGRGGATMILPGETEADSAGTQTIPRDSRVVVSMP
jgi:quercetin dioxygenase-like cupin family protein